MATATRAKASTNGKASKKASKATIKPGKGKPKTTISLLMNLGDFLDRCKCWHRYNWQEYEYSITADGQSLRIKSKEHGAPPGATIAFGEWLKICDALELAHVSLGGGHQTHFIGTPDAIAQVRKVCRNASLMHDKISSLNMAKSKLEFTRRTTLLSLSTMVQNISPGPMDGLLAAVNRPLAWGILDLS